MRFVKEVSAASLETELVVALVITHWAWKDLFLNTIAMTVTDCGTDSFEIALTGPSRDVLLGSLGRRLPFGLSAEATKKGIRVFR